MSSQGSESIEKMPWRRLAGWFVASRVLIWGVAALSHRFTRPGPYYTRSESFLDWFERWDARWYLDIVRHGYSYDPGKASSVDFLPLYPTLVRIASWLIPSVDWAAYAVANAFCFGAAVLLWRLARDLSSNARAANAATLFFLFGPVSFFFAIPYSEAAFVFLALGSFIEARRKRWWVAGALGAAAALTRSVGLLLVVPLGVEFCLQYRDAPRDVRRRAWVKLACVFLPAAGTAAYVGFLAWRFHDPNAYFVSQRYGGHIFSYPWDLFRTYHFATLSLTYQVWFASAVLAGISLLLAGSLLRQPLPLQLFALAMCLLYFSVKSVEAMPRYLSVVYPFYLTLGRLSARWPLAGLGMLLVSAALLATTVMFFVNGYWFT